jgi:CHAT domain/Trypsin-like peptidase domain
VAGIKVPAYLGRVLAEDGTPAGTCFQAAPGVLVTAWHVLDEMGAGAADAVVLVDGLAAGSRRSPAQVLQIDPLHDLAVLRVDQPFAASVAGFAASDSVDAATEVQVLGVSRIEDAEHEYRYAPAVGVWVGPAMRDDQVALGVLSSKSVVKGMSGGPVRRVLDDVVVGVVSGRYNSRDGWMRDTVWLARVEDLMPLLEEVAPISLVEAPLDGAVELVLAVSEDSVRLHGAGVDAAAPHRGVGEGVRGALSDVWRARARVGGQRREAALTLEPATVSLRRAGQLLAESFLPDRIAAALAGVLRRAEAEHVRVRIGIETSAFAGLPWEALTDPVGQRPLALCPGVTVYRRYRTAPVRAIPGPLRIVVAIAAPPSGGGPVLDYERELRNVHAAVRAARAGDAQVRVVQFATTAAIRAALSEADAHVLHLSGHGGPGVLVLEDDQGRARKVPAAKFVDEAIPPGRMPPVVALAACHTSAPASAEPGAASFAQTLIEHGASAVIGTETSVTDRYATRLFARVYAELAAGPEPDVVAAVADARQIVQRELDTSTDQRDQRLGLLDEWSTVTVLAGSGTVRVYDPAVTEPLPTLARQTPRGLLDRGVGEFVGRRREQHELPTALLGEASHGVVLYGIGGVGKTTLAAQLVRRIQELDPSRLVAVVSGELSVDTVFAEVTGAIRRNVGPTGPVLQAVEFAVHVDERWQDRFTVLREHVLDTVPLLIVLDNFEDNLTDDPIGRRVRDETLAGLLGIWADDPGRSRLLITSRFDFTLPNQAHQSLLSWPVGPMSVAETFKLIWSLPALDRLHDADLERVWRMVGGHPARLGISRRTAGRRPCPFRRCHQTHHPDGTRPTSGRGRSNALPRDHGGPGPGHHAHSGRRRRPDGRTACYAGRHATRRTPAAWPCRLPRTRRSQRRPVPDRPPRPGRHLRPRKGPGRRR